MYKIIQILSQILSCSLLTASNVRTTTTTAAERTDDIGVWPRMRHYDIWSGHSDSELHANVLDGTTADSGDIADGGDVAQLNSLETIEMVNQSIEWFDWRHNANDKQNATLLYANHTERTQRDGRVLSIFPVPVNSECTSEDGRRTGNCLNPYVCRSKGGLARGECALGFGVCCIFVANCNETIVNNTTFLVSPNFPSFMSNNVTACTFRVQLISEDISQLRIDFQHFSLGQPNRRTGVCDSDTFSISGGPGGTFTICGQNSGQHVYYDVLTRPLSRQALFGSLRPPTIDQLYPNLNEPFMNSTTSSSAEQVIEIRMNFSNRFLPIRLWEIRIAQIPFSQRAPAGCLQFHTGSQGIIQTFNYAENGRHLANQRYRICIRQEVEMCSIIYEPCDEQSFRIGASNGADAIDMLPFITTTTVTPTIANSTVTNASMEAATTTQGVTSTTQAPTTSSTTTPTTTATTSSTSSPETRPVTMSTSTSALTTTSTTAAPTTTTASTTTTTTTRTTVASTSAATATTTTASTTTAMPTTSTTQGWLDEATTTITSSSSSTTTTTDSLAVLADDIEGSGGDDDYVYEDESNPNRRPRPIRGGFDLLGFLRNAFDFRLRHRRRSRQGRQFFSTCTDRITLPCIIEDFIGAGLGPLPGCEPIHCGAQFCSSGVWPCRIESTVTPFYIGVNFGNGMGKGSAENNIGACLRYSQVQCL